MAHTRARSNSSVTQKENINNPNNMTYYDSDSNSSDEKVISVEDVCADDQPTITKQKKQIIQTIRELYKNFKKQIDQNRIPDRTLAGICACLMYSLCSVSMTFTNKAILSYYNFQYPLCLLYFQHIFTLLLLLIARSTGLIQLSPIIKKDVVTSWYPVNMLFIAMLISGSYALQSLSVPMVTIFKNFTTTLTAMGDFIMFGQQLSPLVLASVTLMVTSSIVAGFHDLTFTLQGYTWMGVNCLVSAGYVLYMRYAMKKTKLNEWSMVYYNNVLSLPSLLPIIYVSGETTQFFGAFSQNSWFFFLLFIWSGVSGFLLSLSSFWAVRTTSPTTYSMVGSLNKIPLTILGVIFFATPMKPIGAVSIAIGLAAGALYSVAKQLSINNSNKPELPRVSSSLILEAK